MSKSINNNEPINNNEIVSSKQQIERVQQTSVWAQIPDELLIRIFSYLELKDLVRCRGVCLSWYSVAGDDHFYYIFAQRVNFFCRPNGVNYFAVNSRELFIKELYDNPNFLLGYQFLRGMTFLESVKKLLPIHRLERLKSRFEQNILVYVIENAKKTYLFVKRDLDSNHGVVETFNEHLTAAVLAAFAGNLEMVQKVYTRINTRFHMTHDQKEELDALVLALSAGANRNDIILWMMQKNDMPKESCQEECDLYRRLLGFAADDPHLNYNCKYLEEFNAFLRENAQSWVQLD